MNYESFLPLLGLEWGPKFKRFIESEDCDKIYRFLKTRSKEGAKILPDSKRTFQTFLQTPYKDLKVIWLTSLPPNESGVPFSNQQEYLTPWYDAISKDFDAEELVEREVWFREPDLSFLSSQGVLLLNTSLTTEDTSTSSVWKPFITYLFESIITPFNTGLSIVLSGHQSGEFAKTLDFRNHYVFKLEDIAPGRPWEHQEVFKKITNLIKSNNRYSIDWMKTDLPF